MKIFATICLVLCVMACQQKEFSGEVQTRKENGHSFLWVDLDQAGDTIDFDISELVDSVRLVKLETSAEAVINRASAIALSSEKLYIYHQEKNLMCFDYNGGFLGNIGHLGQGPFEYTYINRLAYDPLSKQLLVQPSGKMQFYLFDEEGNNPRSISRTLDGNTNLGFVNNEILELGYKYWSRRSFKPKYISFNNQNSQGEALYKDSNLYKVLEVRVGGVTLPLIAYTYNDNYKAFFSRDTLYTLDVHTGEMIPDAVFTASENGFNYTMVERDILKEANTLANKINRVYTEVHAETSKYYLLRQMIYTDTEHGYQMSKAVSYYCVNKRKKTVHPVRLKDTFWGLMLDKNRSPMPFTKWEIVDNQYAILNYQAIDLIEEIDEILDKGEVSSRIQEKLSQLRKGLDEEDNLVLVIYYLK